MTKELDPATPIKPRPTTPDQDDAEVQEILEPVNLYRKASMFILDQGAKFNAVLNHYCPWVFDGGNIAELTNKDLVLEYQFIKTGSIQFKVDLHNYAEFFETAKILHNDFNDEDQANTFYRLKPQYQAYLELNGWNPYVVDKFKKNPKTVTLRLSPLENYKRDSD